VSRFAERVARVRAEMEAQGVDVVLLSVGPDLPYLTGNEAMPLERLTMLVLPRDGDAVLVVPRLEAPRVVDQPDVFAIQPWNETDDPIDLVATLSKGASVAAIGDHTWARFLVDLLAALPATTFRRASTVVSPIRSRKDAAEIAALRAAGAAADRVARQLQSGEIAMVGRTEADVSSDLSRRLIAEGHERVNFAIVGSGPNGASPHHSASGRVLERGDLVVCDFGGRMDGYCSDITRTVALGEAPRAAVDAYAVLREAQQAAVAAAVVGTPCEEVDAVARRIITAAGFGDRFIHRTGHGIGMEEHEDPYIVSGNHVALAPGHAFSVEPGIYTPEQWGMRLEDIVVATDAGPEPLNTVDHGLVVLDI
jgi:Xaa-Pro aminopeptidase